MSRALSKGSMLLSLICWLTATYLVMPTNAHAIIETIPATSTPVPVVWYSSAYSTLSGATCAEVASALPVTSQSPKTCNGIQTGSGTRLYQGMCVTIVVYATAKDASGKIYTTATPTVFCHASNYGYFYTQCPAGSWDRSGVCIVYACPPNQNWKLSNPAISYAPVSCSRDVPEQFNLALNNPAGDLEPSGTAAGDANSSKVMSVSVFNNAIPPQPKSGAVVRVMLDAVAGSGGHLHNELAPNARPKGTLVKPLPTDRLDCVPTNGILGSYDCKTLADGYAYFTYFAPIVSGTYAITAACTNVPCINYSQSTVMDVKVAGLATIPASPFYAFVGGTALHSDNHYLTPQAEAVLHSIAVSYQYETRFRSIAVDPTNPNDTRPLTLNDASLVWGGLLDLKGNWRPSHYEHRRGTAADVRASQSAGAIPKNLFKPFETVLRDYGRYLSQPIDAFLECTQDKKDKPGVPPPPKHNRTKENYCVSQLDGSEDPNRHYHVRLMGVKE